MMPATLPTPERDSAYRWGASVLVAAIAIILTALGFEYIGGYRPCPLCLQQRYAYYAGIPVLFGALVLVTAGQRRWAGLLFAIVAAGFLVNAGLGVYHAGVEWKFWAGPDTCQLYLDSAPAGSGGVLEQLKTVRVIRCDEAPWRFLGLSFAGWNALLSIFLALGAFMAARLSWHRGI